MWLRLYTDALHDPKVQKLSGDNFKSWINLLMLAKEGDGLLPSADDIAFQLRISEAEAQRLTEELTRRGLLDLTDKGLMPHNWDERQFLSDSDPTAALRAKRYRDRTRVVTRDDTDDVTPTRSRDRAETEPEPETETEEKTSRAKPRSVRRPVCDEEFFDECQQNPAYALLDVRMVYHKMVAWCQNKGKQPTRARLLNWLSREERPMTTAPKKPPGNAHVGKHTPAPQPFVPTAEDNEFMSTYIETLIAEEDLIHMGNEYDNIIKRGGAQLEWEIRVVTWYELHKDEPEIGRAHV